MISLQFVRLPKFSIPMNLLSNARKVGQPFLADSLGRTVDKVGQEWPTYFAVHGSNARQKWSGGSLREPYAQVLDYQRSRSSGLEGVWCTAFRRNRPSHR